MGEGAYKHGESFGGFDVIWFTEAEYPEGAIQAQQIQAASYLHMGYVTPEAIDHDGRLFAELDHSRGELVTYYMALDAAGVPHASLRLGHIPEGGRLRDLASYRRCEDVIQKEYEEFLETFADQVRDCSALSIRPGISSLAAFSLVREAVRQGIRADQNEVWIVASTEMSWQSLKASFGTSLIQTGKPVPPEHDDARIATGLKLIPGLVEIRPLPNTLAIDIECAPDESSRQRHLRSLNLLIEGLTDDELGYDSETLQRVRSLVPAPVAAR